MNMIEAYEHLHGIKWEATVLSIRACWADAWNAAIKNEREACAKLCDDLPSKYPAGPWFNDDMSVAARECAAAIRKRALEAKGDKAT